MRNKHLEFEEQENTSTDVETTVLNTLGRKDKSHPKGRLPSTLYIFPAVRRPFFPGMAAPVMVEHGPYYEALKAISKTNQKCIGVVLTKDEEADITKITLDDLHKTGVVARILRIIPMEQGSAQVILSMEGRMHIEANASKNKRELIAKVSYHDDEVALTKELKAYAISIISTIKELLKLNPLFKEELQIFLSHSDFTEPGKLADFAVALTTASREELQDVLEAFDIQGRISKALVLLKKEVDVSRLQNTINQKIESTISKSQKEYYLREQLKTIKRELGIEKEEKTVDKEKFESRIAKKDLPKEAAAAIKEEIDKLNMLEPLSPEYAMCRNYVDWLTTIPWGVKSADSNNLKKSEEILEKDHYGLSDIKKCILEFIGVSQLSGKLKGTILCFVGPPGVGKTSIGKSIAHALNRKFFRFSVGGMRDEAEIKGHRRTYIGAMPGKIIQALKACQTMNPVIMLDEVDKIGSSYQGDPASALLEVLDPEQNSEFLDHYLDVRCDLSDILFIVTANVLDTIPEPLLDRMEILRLSGYVLEEKMQIAKRYLIPKQKKAAGITPKQVTITDASLKEIINSYAREAGVRTLENTIKKIYRKIAVDFVHEIEKSKDPSKVKKLRRTVAPKELPQLLGKPMFLSDRYYEKTPPGVSVGLAWTSHGGATLYVESIRVPSEKSEMKLTGQAGAVMKESSEIAWSYLHGSLAKYAPNKTFFDKSAVHMHIPEGATPKDGPSAGITMVTSLLSLLLNEAVLPELGMTGELTLTGRVLPIGGVKEKLVAAKRSGLTTIIMPKGNERDYEELPEKVKKGLRIHFVNHFDEVFPIAFPKRTHKLRS